MKIVVVVELLDDQDFHEAALLVQDRLLIGEPVLRCVVIDPEEARKESQVEGERSSE